MQDAADAKRRLVAGAHGGWSKSAPVDDTQFFGTAAQVIRTLLVVTALEARRVVPPVVGWQKWALRFIRW